MMHKKHILCPIDFSEGSSKIVEIAIMLAKGFSAQLTVLNVVEHLSDSVCGDVGVRDIQQQMENEAHKKMDVLAKNYHLHQQQTLVMTGYPKMTILNIAKNLNMDLIVIGQHGTHGITHQFLGSTSRAVANAADCDVYIVQC